MAKALLSTYNSNIGAVAANGIVPLGSAVRRFGCYNGVNTIDLGNSGIVLSAPGYYTVEATVNATAGATGTLTATVYQNGIAVTGASISGTAAAEADSVVLSIPAFAVRVFCGSQPSTLTIILSGGASTAGTANVLVEKV